MASRSEIISHLKSLHYPQHFDDAWVDLCEYVLWKIGQPNVDINQLVTLPGGNKAMIKSVVRVLILDRLMHLEKDKA